MLHVYRRQRGSVFKNIPTFDGTYTNREANVWLTSEGDIILTQFHFYKLIAEPPITTEARSFVFAICLINNLLEYVYKRIRTR